MEPFTSYPSGKSRVSEDGFTKEVLLVDCGWSIPLVTTSSWKTPSLSAEENGLSTEVSYNYITTRGMCRDSSCNVDVVKGSVAGYKDVSTVGERTLMLAVAWEPVSVAMEAYQSSFQSHESADLC